MLPAAKYFRVAAFPRQVRLAQRQKPGQARQQPSLSPAELQPCCPCPHRCSGRAQPQGAGTTAGQPRNAPRPVPAAPWSKRGAGFSCLHLRPKPLQDHTCCLIPSPHCTSECNPLHRQKRGSQRHRAPSALPHNSVDPPQRGQKQQGPRSGGDRPRGRWVLGFSCCCQSPK